MAKRQKPKKLQKRAPKARESPSLLFPGLPEAIAAQTKQQSEPVQAKHSGDIFTDVQTSPHPESTTLPHAKFPPSPETGTGMIGVWQAHRKKIAALFPKNAQRHGGNKHRRESGSLWDRAKQHWRMLAIIGCCAALFALALFFALNDMEKPVSVVPEVNGTTENATPTGTAYPRVAWRGKEELCSPEFAEDVLDDTEKLARRDGNDCVKLIAQGLRPQECLRNPNLRFVSTLLRKYANQRYNATCDSQQSFEAAVAREYYKTFTRYTKYPDLGYETPYPNVQDFAVPPDVLRQVPELPAYHPPLSVRCDPEWLRENKKELEHRENIAALTGTVSEELKALRRAVQEMGEACAR